jgi:hypothetical protein
MLDVHPPHNSTHTWKDFFIHLATIVVGLLIAVSLEQTVEYAHHRHQLAETREALRSERDHNRESFADDVGEFRRQTAAMINNLIVLRHLQQHPGTPQEKLPGILVWHAYRPTYSDSAWKTAQQSGVTALMPQEEVRANDVMYELLEKLDTMFETVFPEIVRGHIYSLADPDPSHLTPAQVADEIAYCEEALVRQYSTFAEIVRITAVEPDFGPGLTAEEINKQLRSVEAERNPDLAAAIAITNSRLPADRQLPIPKPGAKP